MGASDHLVTLKGNLHAYREFEQPVEVAATNIGKIYTYGTGYLQVAMSAHGIELEVDLEDVKYVPRVHVRACLSI